jgi:RHS repeat-associated protein
MRVRSHKLISVGGLFCLLSALHVAVAQAQTPTVTGVNPNIGGPGEYVGIGGSNFGATQGTSTVKFNGVMAAVNSWTNAGIQAIVPNGATTGDIVVTVNGVSSPTNGSDVFTVTTVPTVTGVNPSVGGPGEYVGIGGSNFGATQGTSTVKFNGVVAAINSWTNIGIQAIVPNGATTGNVVVTVNGVSSPPSGGSIFTVTISPQITSANTTTFTVGTSKTFTLTATGSPTPTLSESGALPEGVTFNASTGVFSGTPVAGSGDVYPMTFTATNGVSPNATQNFTLTVNNTTSGTVYYYFGDQLGTSRVMTDSSGNVCYDADFYPYGGENAYTNNCDPDFKFTGKERDTESGLDNFGARYYSSLYGRFVSADWSAIPAPIPYADFTNPQTLNLYAIVHDNPETFADLDGHDDDVPFYAKNIAGLGPGDLMNLGLNPFTGQDPSQTQTWNDAHSNSQSTSKPKVSIKKKKYSAHSNQASGGVDIQLQAKVEGSKYKHFNWRQTLTNSTFGGPYADTYPGAPPPYYYWSPADQTHYENVAQEEGDSTYFEDYPSRPYSGTGTVWWHAVLSLVGINGNGTYDVLKSFSYGFTMNSSGVHLEDLKELP